MFRKTRSRGEYFDEFNRVTLMQDNGDADELDVELIFGEAGRVDLSGRVNSIPLPVLSYRYADMTKREMHRWEREHPGSRHEPHSSLILTELTLHIYAYFDCSHFISDSPGLEIRPNQIGPIVNPMVPPPMRGFGSADDSFGPLE